MHLTYNLKDTDTDDFERRTNISTESKKPTPFDSESHQPLEPKKNSLWQSFKDVYFEFCSNTSIHGFQYFGQQRPRKEILFWICIFIVSFYYCTSIIMAIYVKWDAAPVIVSFSEKSTPIWNVPFPAVTICPETKRAKNATDPFFLDLAIRFFRNNKEGLFSQSNLTYAEFRDMAFLMHFCNEVDEDLHKLSDPPPLDYFAIMNEMVPDFNSHYFGCTWFGKFTDCNKLFTKVYTDGGVCYTFNSLKAVDLYRENTFQHQESLRVASNENETGNKSLSWSLEEGYGEDHNVYTYPARVLSSGTAEGLAMFLQTFDGETDYSCTGPTQGFRLLLHSPDDVPSVSKHFVRISMERQSLIAIKPKMITTAPNIAAYQPHKRQCYFNNERRLKFYKVYSQNNCERECLTNFTYVQCGCVKFTMPRTPDMTVCDENKINCYRQARKLLLVHQFVQGLKKSNSSSPSDGTTQCDCMPACTSLDYETEISEGIFDLENQLKSFGGAEEHNEMFPGSKISQLLIYFKENQFITSRRSEMYGFTELLANFGGICGLFMGISVLSIIEMLYHFTLRLWSNMTRRREVI